MFSYSYVILLLLLNAPVGALPIRVAAGGATPNTIEVLGLSPNGIAVRELIKGDEEDTCIYPDDMRGVTLKTWRLPGLGQSALPTPQIEVVVYRAGAKAQGCTLEVEAAKALQSAKNEWTAKGIPWKNSVEHIPLVTTLHERDFSGFCYITSRSRSGCILKKKALVAGKRLQLSLKLSAKSECVQNPKEAMEMGCQAERHYGGSLKLGNRIAEFDLVAEAMQGNAQNELRSVSIYSQGGITIGVFYFSWSYVTSRELTPIVIRLQ